MTRAEFMGRLRRGLVGMPTAAAAEIAADYEMHFEDGAAAGRTEAEVAAALGDPDRLARELRAEAGARRWDQEKNPSAAAGAVFAVLGLGAIDLLIARQFTESRRGSVIIPGADAQADPDAIAAQEPPPGVPGENPYARED